MSELIVGHDSQLMMLELGINKLCIPKCSPFDSVILSKFIVSFRFLDDEWIDIMPNRLDYKKYRGSNGEIQCFNGGKSIVFSIPERLLAEEQRCLFLEIRVRREISRYFEMTDGQKHNMDMGKVDIKMDELYNGIEEELKFRCKLGNYLQLAHERDPISRSIKGTYELKQTRPGSTIDLYIRLSHLGNSVITEIDRPSRGCERTHFYAQEEHNLARPYECLQLKPESSPKTHIPLSTVLRARSSLQFICDCSEEQKHKAIVDECTKTQGTCTDGDGKGDGDDDDDKKKTTPSMMDASSNTDPDSADKACGPNDEFCQRDTDGDDLGKYGDGMSKRRRRGSGPANYIPKPIPCPPICEPCCPIICTVPCDMPCIPTSYCPPPVCCYD